MGNPFHDACVPPAPWQTVERFLGQLGAQLYVPAGFENKGENVSAVSGRFYASTEDNGSTGTGLTNDPNLRWWLLRERRSGSMRDTTQEVVVGKTHGAGWGKMTYEAPLAGPVFLRTPRRDGFSYRPLRALLAPRSTDCRGQAAFDFYSPYVLVMPVTGEWAASLADRPQIEIRVLEPKPRFQSDPDVWSDWQVIASAGGPFRIELGGRGFNGRDASIHGVYRFQLRFSLTPDHQERAWWGSNPGLETGLKRFDVNPPAGRGRNTFTSS